MSGKKSLLAIFKNALHHVESSPDTVYCCDALCNGGRREGTTAHHFFEDWFSPSDEERIEFWPDSLGWWDDNEKMARLIALDLAIIFLQELKGEYP
jgi:hypothetical protein